VLQLTLVQEGMVGLVLVQLLALVLVLVQLLVQLLGPGLAPVGTLAALVLVQVLRLQLEQGEVAA
jgi:hypothetical protein